jgi:D-glycero-beta-D-manno-heptose-7-phosphate kinase
MKPLSAETIASMRSLLDAFSRLRILVVGDMVLDQFVVGVSSRVSREAPVLILRHSHTENVPGGAGNAAANLRALGAEVIPAGLIGTDDNGALLAKDLERRGIYTQGLLPINGAQTTTKSRIMGGLPHSPAQQIVRIDREFNASLNADQEKSFLDFIERQLEECHGALLSDYGYNAVTTAVCNSVRNICRRRQIPVVTDSRFRLCWFHDLTALTPNITEVEEAYGVRFGTDLEALRKVAADIILRQRLEALLVTRGKFGMILYDKQGNVEEIPVYGTDQVADVTGAGDTVISTFTLALAAGACLADAARMSNFAGGIVVMKHGTATVSIAELWTAIRATGPVPESGSKHV